MSFPRAPLRRFNESQGCAPAPGFYDPKFLTDVGATTRRTVINGDKSARFPAFRSGAITPSLPEPEVAETFFRYNSYRRSSSSSPFTTSNTSVRSSSVSVSNPGSTRASRCNSFTSVLMGRPMTAGVITGGGIDSNYTTPRRNASASRLTRMATQTTARDLEVQFNKEREDWLEKEHHLQSKIDQLRDHINELEVQVNTKKLEESTDELDKSVLESTMKILKVSIEESEEENKRLKEKSEKHEMTRVELEARVIALSETNTKLENSVKELEDEMKILKTVAKSLEDTNEELNSKLASTVKENSSLINKLEEAGNGLIAFSNERNEWTKKENEYLGMVAELQTTLENNNSLLLESDERVSVLVSEVESHYQVGREKVCEMEKIRTTWEAMEVEYIKNIEELKGKVAEISSALEHEKSKVVDLTEEKESYAKTTCYNMEDKEKRWNEKEMHYKDTVAELNAKCKDLNMSAMLYKGKLLSMHNTWKSIRPIKDQLLELKTELSNLLTNKETKSTDVYLPKDGDKAASKDDEPIQPITKPIVQLVAEIEKENVTLRENISLMQGAIADILASDVISPATITDDSSEASEYSTNSSFLSTSKDVFTSTLSSMNSVNNETQTNIDELLEGSNAIKKALTENIKKKVSNLGLNIVLDEELDDNNNFNNGDVPSSLH